MSTITGLRWLGAGVLGTAALWLSVLNWVVLGRRLSSTSSVSWVPLVGGALGIAALVLLPLDIFSTTWWVPLIADAGCLPGLTATLIGTLLRRPSGPNPR